MFLYHWSHATFTSESQTTFLFSPAKMDSYKATDAQEEVQKIPKCKRVQKQLKVKRANLRKRAMMISSSHWHLFECITVNITITKG